MERLSKPSTILRIFLVELNILAFMFKICSLHRVYLQILPVREVPTARRALENEIPRRPSVQKELQFMTYSRARFPSISLNTTLEKSIRSPSIHLHSLPR